MDGHDGRNSGGPADPGPAGVGDERGVEKARAVAFREHIDGMNGSQIMEELRIAVEKLTYRYLTVAQIQLPAPLWNRVRAEMIQTARKAGHNVPDGVFDAGFSFQGIETIPSDHGHLDFVVEFGGTEDD